MLAGQIVQRRRIEIVGHPEPEPANPGEVIFQPEVACLCGSDRPFFDEQQPTYPLQVGLSLHEMVGTIVSSNGETFKVGQHVLAVPPNHEGIFERMAISEERIVPLEAGRSLEEMVIAQPLGTVLYGLRKLPNLLGWRTVVVGQGPIGQLFCAALRNLGASQVIAMDLLASRLRTSRAMGASAVVDSGRDDPVDAIRDLTGGKMADLVVEAAGHQGGTLNLCIDLCRRQGRVHYFGVPPKRIDGVHWFEVVAKNLTISSSHSPDFAIDFPLAIQWISEGRVDVRPLLTHRLPLSEIQQAFEIFSNRQDGALKVTLRFPGTVQA